MDRQGRDKRCSASLVTLLRNICMLLFVKRFFELQRLVLNHWWHFVPPLVIGPDGHDGHDLCQHILWRGLNVARLACLCGAFCMPLFLKSVLGLCHNKGPFCDQGATDYELFR